MCAKSTLCTDEKICWRFKVSEMLKPDCYDLMAFHVIGYKEVEAIDKVISGCIFRRSERNNPF